MPTAYKKIPLEETEAELSNMSREEVVLYLTEKERLFCEYYICNHNAILAARKAGYSGRSLTSVAYRIRLKTEINRYICWLKLGVSHECQVRAVDVVDQYIRIGFADITDFVNVGPRRVTLIEGHKIDGQLVKSVKQGKDGVMVELYDKMQALAKLERYFEILPKDWKQEIEERKVELLEQRIEIERIKAGQGQNAETDDGFIKALKETASEVWDDDE